MLACVKTPSQAHAQKLNPAHLKPPQSYLPPQALEHGLYVVGYMTGYVCSPQQWAYVRVTGALAAAAVHSPLLTMVRRFCNLPTATSTVHVATVPPLIPPGPPTTLILILSNRRTAALAPEGKSWAVNYIQVI